MPNPKRVLFLCTANACRSQMAEGFARHYGEGVLEAFSAGASPTALFPLTVAAMQEVGLDISAHQAKGLADVPSEVDLVVTMCDQAAETCPFFPSASEVRHWSLPDPAAATGSLEEVMAAFREVRDEIQRRVRALVDELRGEYPS